MTLGAKGLLLITIIIFIFLKNQKLKIGTISTAVLLLLFGHFLWYISVNGRTISPNTISYIYSAIMICLGSALLVRQKHIEKVEKGIDTTYESSLGLRIVCFLFPIVGLIVYAVNIVQNPKIAKECGKFAIMGFCIGLIAIGIIVACLSIA